jgi:methionyl-tRNA formyltransferase
MKILIFSGSHSRHLFIHKEVLSNFDVVGAVIMQRESLFPDPPGNTNQKDLTNFVRHFKDRDIVEQKTYGNLSVNDTFKDLKTLKVEPDQLNSVKVAKFVSEINADFCFVFGCDIIKDPVFSCLPELTINLHLGLSPWYKGSTTLFWPFYNLEPQEAGITLHYLSKKADEGAILHTSRPELRQGDGIHDVAARCVEMAKSDVVKLLKIFKTSGRIEGRVQKTSGRLYLTKDFIPEHLRIIYDLSDNNIVDEILEKPNQKKTKLFSVLN